MSSDMTFAGKTVLVTGAGGSIGSELCRAICRQKARRLKLLSLTEGALYNVERALRRELRDTELEPILGSARDMQLLAEALSGVDIIVHAAGHKHVPICEANPHAAIANNIGSTYALMTAAAAFGVGQFCLISSDKAVNAASIMGATKRLSELMVRHLASGPTQFFAVRFGNVLDSAGSVLPLWREQLQRGEPITLTDERCERYFMSIPEAVQLVCEVIRLNPADGIFVLDMGKPVPIVQLARQLIDQAGLSATNMIRLIGLRPGEKLKEELHHGGELESTTIEKVFLVAELPPLVPIRERDVQLLLELADARDAGAAPLLWNLIALSEQRPLACRAS